jgi:hypothetical protein
MTATRDDLAAQPELLPCPFCGSAAKTFWFDGALQATCPRPYVECAASDVVAPVAMWNRRAALSSHPAVKALVEAERDALAQNVVATNGVWQANLRLIAERDRIASELAAAKEREAGLREAVDFLRTTIRANIVVKDGPHTVELPDGSIHSGPVAEFLHELLPNIAEVLDRAALASRPEGEATE